MRQYPRVILLYSRDMYASVFVISWTTIFSYHTTVFSCYATVFYYETPAFSCYTTVSILQYYRTLPQYSLTTLLLVQYSSQSSLALLCVLLGGKRELVKSEVVPEHEQSQASCSLVRW